ncbi:hypothetical protein [Acidisoma sp.]|uniref:hypothetical protein n=1 Tax=Acidisoma sp. TaxID=1872115 RepID=UPI003B0005CC
MMDHERHTIPRRTIGRVRMAAVAVLSGAALLAVSGVVVPKPALAWWRGGVWIAGPGYYPYYGPRPYYYPPPIVVAPPPVYYAPPPVYYPPPPVAYPAAAHTCYAPSLTCPMEVARAPGAACYCSDQAGNRAYGTAH